MGPQLTIGALRLSLNSLLRLRIVYLSEQGLGRRHFLNQDNALVVPVVTDGKGICVDVASVVFRNLCKSRPLDRLGRAARQYLSACAARALRISNIKEKTEQNS